MDKLKLGNFMFLGLKQNFLTELIFDKGLSRENTAFLKCIKNADLKFSIKGFRFSEPQFILRLCKHKLHLENWALINYLT